MDRISSHPWLASWAANTAASSGSPAAAAGRRLQQHGVAADLLRSLASRFQEVRASRVALRARLQQALGERHEPGRRLQQAGAAAEQAASEDAGGGVAALHAYLADGAWLAQGAEGDWPDVLYWEEDPSGDAPLWPGQEAAPAEFLVVLQVGGAGQAHPLGASQPGLCCKAPSLPLMYAPPCACAAAGGPPGPRQPGAAD